MVEVVVKDNGRQIASGRAVTGESVIVDMPSDIELWSPENPKLYDLEIKLMSDGKTLDKVDSYAAMRKFSMKMGDKGVVRLQLNNKNLFHYGLLDGDGGTTVYTPRHLTKQWSLTWTRQKTGATI